MSIALFNGFPRQQLSFRQKGNKWGKQCVDFADAKGSVLGSSLVRGSVAHKKVNTDLVNMKLHKEDIVYVLNPNKLKGSFIPEDLQHYPTINAYLEVLHGEAINRPFNWHVVVTNPNAISEIEDEKRDAILESLQRLIQNESVSEEDYQKKLQEQNDYFQYQYQDMREVRANRLLKHYSMQYDFRNIFDGNGILDALIANEEYYSIDIVGGEPYVERIDPLELRIYRSGNSNRAEDADMIIWETYRNISWVKDNYHDVLTKKDMHYLSKLESGTAGDDSDDP